MIRFPKINMFEPYFELRNYKQHNDWFEFSIKWCNHLMFTLSIMGYGFTVGIWLYMSKKAKERVMRTTRELKTSSILCQVDLG
jgi:hypothetical protein